MRSVDSGKWKLVSSASLTRKRKPGVMNSSVSPLQGASVRSAAASAAASSARITVVPTATTRPPRARVRATARLERREEGGVEVQARGRRGHRAALAREDALIALAVARQRRAVDIRRQGHLAPALEKIERVV